MTRTIIALLATLAALYLYWRGNHYRDALRALSRRYATLQQRMAPHSTLDPRRVAWVVKQV